MHTTKPLIEKMGFSTTVDRNTVTPQSRIDLFHMRSWNKINYLIAIEGDHTTMGTHSDVVSLEVTHRSDGKLELKQRGGEVFDLDFFIDPEDTGIWINFKTMSVFSDYAQLALDITRVTNNAPTITTAEKFENLVKAGKETLAQLMQTSLTKLPDSDSTALRMLADQIRAVTGQSAPELNSELARFNRGSTY